MEFYEHILPPNVGVYGIKCFCREPVGAQMKASSHVLGIIHSVLEVVSQITTSVKNEFC